MIDFQAFDFLTFDCYGTLIDWEQGILRCLHRLLAAHGKSLEDANILKSYGDFEAAAEQGKYRSYREVLQEVVERFGEQLHFKPSEDEIRSLPDSLADWKPWPDTVEALTDFKCSYRLAIISNVDDDLFSATRPRLGVSFDQIVTAQQARAYKPSLEIFKLALSRINVPVEKILHVGQSLYHDVVPATALGMGTVWVNRPSAQAGVGAVKAVAGKPDLEVSSLAGLAALVAAGRSKA